MFQHELCNRKANTTMTTLFSKITLGLAGALLVASPAMAQAPEWTKQVTRMFASKQTYPSTAQMRGEEGTAKVKVYIGADGSVEKAELVAGTGSASLDKEALSVPSKVGRVPAPPAGATTLTVPMTWKLA
jgi:protein TonB